MKEKILRFKDDKEYDEWLSNKKERPLLELIKDADDNGYPFVIEIGDEIYIRRSV